MSEETLRTIFAKNLRHYLELRGKNQADLCQYMNVSSATASDWCNAKKMPRADKMQLIANWLSVPIGELMEEHSEETTQTYYLNDETREIAQEIYDNEDLRMLFDVSRKASPERLKAYYNLIKAMQDTEKGND